MTRYTVILTAAGFAVVDSTTGEMLGLFHARFKAERKAAELNEARETA